MERVEGVSRKSLSTTPHHLERGGPITRTVKAQVPIRVDYGATDRALRGWPKCISWTWVAVHLHAFTKARRAFDRRVKMEGAAESVSGALP